MKRIKTLGTTIIVIIIAALVASCGASTIGAGQLEPVGEGGQDNGAVDSGAIDAAQLPQFPSAEGADDVEASAKSLSWLSHPNHLAPVASLYGGIDPGDPNCYLLKGYKHQYATFYKPDSIAYAMYKIPLGALEPDLLEMKVATQVGAAGDQYFAAIANFTGMHWQFYGPSAASSWYTDVTTLGYDFTNAAGDMYIVLIALPGQSLHITDITLNFKDREKPDDDPTVWNVYGQAFEDYASGSPHAGYLVTFENLGTGVTFSTLTAVDGRWGLNLPEGHYKFGIDSNEMLLDVSGPVSMIDYIYDVSGFGIKLDLINTGDIVYQDDNAAYVGSVVPMPIITANNF
ncbi:MAG TPA: carboxypeptidase regulatory-like domain-containing protein [Firmicutes bacterium]|nr:carboxypeptidase regulatory-like domain-containing protein [Bacillota bacterium]